MNKNLEALIGGECKPIFKSEGECQIARFLECNSIKYKYESSVLVYADNDKPRIWFPDFYLPEFGVYIEFYGLAGEPGYDRGIKVKESVYAKNNINVIPVYPWMFRKNWQGHIMQELEKNTLRRYRDLMAKPYWSRS
jgi:hypothetical protein